MAAKKHFTTEEARTLGDQLGMDWATVDIEQFRMGLVVEMEHGSDDEQTNVTHGDPVMTGKIAWAHLNEYPDYCTRLARLEKEADEYWATRRLKQA